MQTDPLHSATLKITRAKQHIDDLNGQSQAFFDQYWRILLKDKPKIGKRSLFLKADKPIPEYFALWIGDVVHNLRSALDHVVWAFIAPHNPSKPDRVQFPICKDADAFPKAIRSRQINLAGPEVVRIITEIGPYPGGNCNHVVRLHELNILDKHKLLTPVAGLTFFDNFDLRKFDPAAPEMPVYHRFGAVGCENDDIVEWSADPSDRRAFVSAHNKKISATFQILFGSGQPFAGTPVIKSLTDATKVVEKVIAKFRGLTP